MTCLNTRKYCPGNNQISQLGVRNAVFTGPSDNVIYTECVVDPGARVERYLILRWISESLCVF